MKLRSRATATKACKSLRTVEYDCLRLARRRQGFDIDSWPSMTEAQMRLIDREPWRAGEERGDAWRKGAGNEDA